MLLANKFHGRATVWTLVALVVGCLALGAGAAPAQPALGPPGVDHYLVYRVLNPPTFSAPVALSDQFLLNIQYVTYTLDYFMTPVNKNNEGMIDTVTHYTWWRISTHPFSAVVSVDNQFGQGQLLKVSQPRFLLNPALKNSAAGGPLPLKNHFKVYDVQGPPQSRYVSLVDQFYPLTAYVDSVVYLANPAQKEFQGVVYPVLDPVGHLAIYKITPQQPAPPDPGPVLAQDEFGFWNLVLGPRVYLCVPSFKHIATPAKAHSWGGLKGQYR